MAALTEQVAKLRAELKIERQISAIHRKKTTTKTDLNTLSE